MADDDEIYIDVVPKLDEAAADEVEANLEGRFSDVGKKITDQFGKVGHSIGDKIADSIKDRGSSIGDSIRDHVSDDLFSDLGEKFGHVLVDAMHGSLPDIPGMFGGAKDSLGNIFGDLKSGDISGGLGDLSDTLKKIGGGNLDGLSGTLDQLSGTLGTLSNLPDALSGVLKGDLDGLTDVLRGLPGADTTPTSSGKGKAGGGKKKNFLGDAGDAVDSARTFTDALPGESAGKANKFLGAAGSGLAYVDAAAGSTAFVNQHTGHTTDVRPEKNPNGWWGSMFGMASNLMPWAHRTDTLTSRGTGLPDIGTTGQVGNAGALPSSLSTNTMGVNASVVNINGSVSIPGVSTSSGHSSTSAGGSSVGSAGSSGGLPSAKMPKSKGGVGTAGGAGALHFASGGFLPGDPPGHDNMLGALPGGGVFGLESGEGIVKADVAQTRHGRNLIKALNTGTLPGFKGGGILDEGGDGGGGALSSPGPKSASGSDGGSGKEPNQGNLTGPGGQKHATSAPTTSKSRDQKLPHPEAETPHGTGKGFGIGGGLIGGAEGAAAMAASMTPAGPAGGMAVQAAMQEANRAVAYAGQVAAIVGIEAPLDTFSVRGNRMSNLAKGTLGKIGMGLVGDHGFTGNHAGNTHPPLQTASGDEGGRGGGVNTGGPGGQGPGVNIEKMHVHNNGQGTGFEQDLHRAGNQYSASYPA